MPTWNYICLLGIFIILVIREFFTPALADGFSLESDWQQVSLNFKDTSQFYGWSP